MAIFRLEPTSIILASLHAKIFGLEKLEAKNHIKKDEQLYFLPNTYLTTYYLTITYLRVQSFDFVSNPDVLTPQTNILRQSV